MNILFEVPANLRAAAAEAGELIVCVPVDMTIGAIFKDGYFIAGKSRAMLIYDGVTELSVPIENMRFTARAMIGNGILEMSRAGNDENDDDARIIARFSMSHMTRFAYVAAILNKLVPVGLDSGETENKCPKCGRALEKGSMVCPKCRDTKANLARLGQIAKPYTPSIIFCSLVFVLVTGLSLLPPYISRRIVDDVLDQPSLDKLGYLLSLVGIMMAAYVINAVMNSLRRRAMVNVSEDIGRSLRNSVFNKIQELSLGYISQRKAGDLMNRVTQDTNRVQNFLQQQLSMMINMLLMMIGLCLLLFTFNWRLTVLILAPTPFVVLIGKGFWKNTFYRYTTQWRLWDRTNSQLQDILSGIRVVKAFGQEAYETKRFGETNEKLANRIASNERFWSTFFPILGFSIGIGQYFLYYYGSRMVLGVDPSGTMTLGELIQFSSYVGMLYGPLGYVSFIPRMLAEAMTSLSRIFEVTDTEPDIRDKEEALQSDIEGHVELKDVTFGYKSYEPVLKEISLKVGPGEMIGLVGASGTGKTTLINLLMRFYDVQGGNISVDGKDIRDISRECLRGQIGTVLQDNFLFTGTIMDNIRYAKAEATPEEVIAASKIANAHDFIVKFPDGYDTKVGENGHNLSGGERQRMAIARAILHNPRILLLDEATASLDTETEQMIQDALERLVKNRTTIAIAHRLSTLRHATRIVVLDKGRIAETGTHEELLRQRGIYYDLVMAQRQMSKRREEKEGTLAG